MTWTNKDKVLISTGEGRYDYEWVDPGDLRAREVRLLEEAGFVAAQDGRPAGSDLPAPTDGNLLVTGDALHLLDALSKTPEFAERYVGKVKLVYIDPPFNTGQAFEHYEDNLEHSIWLTMLRDRIRQLKPLLAPDASVWVHLDDAEVHRMRSVLDETLGAENFVATVIWQKSYSPRNDAGAFSTDQDYILVYAKRPGWRTNRLSRLASRDALYRSPDGDPQPWVSGDPAAPGAATHQGMVYGIQSPFTGEMIYPANGRCWHASQQGMQALLEEWGVPYTAADIHDEARRAVICDLPKDRIRSGVQALVLAVALEEAQPVATQRLEQGNWPRLYFTKGGAGGLKFKRYLSEIAQDRAPQTLWMHDEVGHNRSAKNEVKTLFPGVVPFSTPKPEALLERVIHVSTNPGDIVLDFYAGSGTTAAVAHKMGRRWVACELSTATVERFTLPRLQRVVDGADRGGVTSSTTYEPVGMLPDGVGAKDARLFSSLLGKFAKTLDDPAHSGETEGDDESWSDPAIGKAVKALRAAARTRKVITTRWQGGGSFRHLRVGPSMFETVEGIVYLARWARGGDLARAVAAQFGFRFDESHYPFAGRKGRKLLAVVDGATTIEVVEHILAELPDGHSVAIYATSLDPAARSVLTGGSSLEKVPQAILETYRATARRRRTFDWATPLAEGDKP